MTLLTLAEFDVVAILSRLFHTTCAATLLGGAVYLRFVLAPAGAGGDTEDVCFAGRRSAWAACVGVSTALLLVSGLYNFVVIVMSNQDLPSPYHAVFGVKFLLAFVVFAIMALLAGKSQTALRVRANMRLWLNVALAVTLAVFALGAVLRSVPKVPKQDAPAASRADSTPPADVIES